MSYWADRLIKERDALFNLAAGATERELAHQYEAAYKRLSQRLRLLYNDIVRGNITSATQLYQYQNYYEIVNAINDELVSLGISTNHTLKPKFEAMYENQQKILAKHKQFSPKINTAEAENVVNGIWANDGLTWSDRVWKHKDVLAATIEKGLIDYAAAGRSPNELIKQLRSEFNASYAEAQRLVRTELTHIQQEATLTKFRDSGLHYVKVMATKDERTCKLCMKNDGRIFELDKIATDDYLAHPNCRCCLIPILPSEEKIYAKYRGQGMSPKGTDTDAYYEEA